jgi:hypothetical protein
MQESSLSANLKSMLNTNQTTVSAPIHENDLDLAQQILADHINDTNIMASQPNPKQFRSVPKMVEEQKTLQKSNIAILQKPIKNIFDLENEEGTKVITTRLRLSQIRQLKDFCYYLDIKTGRDNKLQDVIMQALTEFLDNHPIDNLEQDLQ